MAKKVSYLITGEPITRRSFLKRSLGAGLFVLAAGTASGALASFTGCAAFADVTVTSTRDFNHTHNMTIPGADITGAPAQKTYTSDGASHQHAITLTRQDFENLRIGYYVTAVSTATGTTPHVHLFTIQRA